MNKTLLVIVVLLSVITVETGYIAFGENLISNYSNLTFDTPKSGKDIYDDLKSLNCKIFKAESSFTSSAQYSIKSYNASMLFARDSIVVIYQYIYIDILSGNPKTINEEIQFVIITTPQWIYYQTEWHVNVLGKNTSVVNQMVNTRTIPFQN